MRNRLFALMIFSGFLVLRATAGEAAPVRIAVLADSSQSDLLALVEAELSKDAGIDVLGREDLEKLGREAEIRDALSASNFGKISLLPADGILVLSAPDSKKKDLAFARLIAVQAGIIVREVPLPEGADPVARVRELGRELTAFWPKLGAAQKHAAGAFSLLGLRFDFDAAGARATERRFNLLLASRLSASPGVVVLERWRLNDAIFEKSLGEEVPSPFWKSGSLIDGTLHRQADRIEARLRLRTPDGKEKIFEEKDTLENLPLLVDRLSAKILEQPPSSAGWNPEAEAEHYARLGRWCVDNRLYEQAQQAIETALALGDASRTTQMLQVKAYAIQAYPDDLRVLNNSYMNGVISLAKESLPGRLRAAARAALLMREYVRTHRDFSSEKWNPEDPVSLSIPVLNNCLRVLRAAYENGLQDTRADLMSAARREARQLISEMEEPVQKKSYTTRSCFLECKIGYASLWQETPAGTLAFYRKVLSDPKVGSTVRNQLFRALVEPYLDGDGKPVFVSAIAQSNAPWIIGWQGESKEDLKAIWRKFVEEYGASSDPVEQADALKFEFFSCRTEEGRDRTLLKIMALLKAHPEAFQSPRGGDFLNGFDRSYQWARRRSENAQCLADLLELYRTKFLQRVKLPAVWVYDLATIPDQQKPSTESLREVLAALDGYAQWHRAQPSRDDEVTKALARAEQAIVRMRPELAKPENDTGALAVRRLWMGRNEGSGQSNRLPVSSRTLTVFENKIWFLTLWHPHKIVCVDPETLGVTSVLPIPEEFDPKPGSRQSLAVSEKWLAIGLASRVILYSRKDQQWQSLDLPPSSYKPVWIGEELYVLYDVERGDRITMRNTEEASLAGSGLIHVLLPEGKLVRLVSSRRVPPVSALDGKPMGRPTGLWLGADGLTMALHADNPTSQVYASPIGENNWHSVLEDSSPGWVQLTGAGALIGHGLNQLTFAKLTLMDAKGAHMLLGNPSSDKAGVKEAVWNFPESLKRTPVGHRSEFSPIMRGDDLCLALSTLGESGEGQTMCLYYFAKGERDGVRIPLTFDASQIANPTQAEIVRRPQVGFQGLAATASSLIIYSGGADGFWVIPWSEIDAYRAGAVREREEKESKPDAGSPQSVDLL